MPLPPRGVLWIVLCVLLATLAWRFGHRSGVRDSAHIVAARTSAQAEASRAAAADRVVRQKAELGALARERDIARATIGALRGELERQGRLSAEERAELELYRRIGSDELPSGLTVDEIERRRGPPATLAITLVQARGRGRIRGRIEVRSDAAGTAGARAMATTSGGLEEVGWSTTFDLRFFETLEMPQDALGEPFPDAVVVDVIPEGARHDPFRRRFGREAIRIVD